MASIHSPHRYVSGLWRGRRVTLTFHSVLKLSSDLRGPYDNFHVVIDAVLHFVSPWMYPFAVASF